jgi:ectoine hydroxylase-related dioxygenase (phytanoyl-CoA dioxygenase family)
MSGPDAALKQLEERGYVILERVLTDEELAAAKSALEPFESGRRFGRNDFEGARSVRVYSLAAKGQAFLSIAEHPRVLEVIDRWLTPNYLLSTFQSIRLHPGEKHQAWHTDDAFYPIPRPRTHLALSTIWALEDFTVENGATEVIPGSHLWGHEHPDERAHEAVPVVMPAGSVVLFEGALWHRGGANTGAGTRLALSPQYCQPWLRPQESQLLIMPPAAAVACSPRMRSLLGYNIHPPFIGQVEGMHPIRLVDPEFRSHDRAQQSKESALADEVLRRPKSKIE